MLPLLPFRREAGGGDAEVNFGSGERPKYRALRRIINQFFGDLSGTLRNFTVAVHALTGLEDAADEGRFRLTAGMAAGIKAAGQTFVTRLIGVGDTREEFARRVPTDDHPDGQIQQYEQAARAVGLNRAAAIVGRPVTLDTARMSPDTIALLENAFDRLSQNGRMRLALVQDEVLGVLAGAQQAGLNPIATGRLLQTQFDGYSSDFQRLARTEMAIASETALRDQFRALDVTHVTILIGAGACPICLAYEGRVISLEDEDNLPIFHPNCACSVSPVGARELPG
jgi:hypothetical protein